MSNTQNEEEYLDFDEENEEKRVSEQHNKTENVKAGYVLNPKNNSPR
jgi:hypothetical protein